MAPFSFNRRHKVTYYRTAWIPLWMTAQPLQRGGTGVVGLTSWFPASRPSGSPLPRRMMGLSCAFQGAKDIVSRGNWCSVAMFARSQTNVCLYANKCLATGKRAETALIAPQSISLWPSMDALSRPDRYLLKDFQTRIPWTPSSARLLHEKYGLMYAYE